MMLGRLDIQGFGKFENKSVEFKNGINIVYGENESGKTTIHNFIDGMFYGFLKPNMKSTRYLDEHKLYEPWKKNKYAGIISFVYDEESYRIEREFTRRNESTKVFLESTGEEITNQINTGSRTRILQPGFHFFGFNSNVYRNTISIKQLKTKTEEDLSKEIKEKLVNATHALDDKISVKKAIKSLEDDLKDIGSERAPTSRYGKTRAEIVKLKEDINDLNTIKDEYNEIVKESEELEEQYLNLKDKSDKNIGLIKDIEYLELQDIYNKGLELSKEIVELKENVQTLKNYLLEDDYKNNDMESFNKNRKLSLIGIGSTIIIYLILSLTIDVNFIIGLVGLIVLTSLGFIFFKNSNMLKEVKVIDEENLKNHLKLKSEYEINTSQLENKKILYNRVMNNYTLEDLEGSLEKYTLKNNVGLDSKDLIIQERSFLQDELSNIKIEMARNEANLKNLEKDLDTMVIYEEELSDKESLVEKMYKDIASIELAKSTIQELSKGIHEDFAPVINEKVSDIIGKITKGKYSKIKVDDNLDLGILNPVSNEILKDRSLSGGTIDQLYFSLRCGIISSISQENLPLILDDCFIQYDDSRLKNVLEFLSNLGKERQIILFTCHNREKDLLDGLDVEYNLINLG